MQLPFATVALSGCTNEYVSITGVLHVVSQTFTDPANIFHDHFTFSLSGGKGVGIDSGIGYIMTETVTVADEEGPPPSVFMEILDSNLNGQGSAPNQNAQIRLHVTTDAQGNVTAFFDSATVTCLG